MNDLVLRLAEEIYVKLLTGAGLTYSAEIVPGDLATNAIQQAKIFYQAFEKETQK